MGIMSMDDQLIQNLQRGDPGVSAGPSQLLLLDFSLQNLLESHTHTTSRLHVNTFDSEKLHLSSCPLTLVFLLMKSAVVWGRASSHRPS